MKEAELRKHTTCDVCKYPLGARSPAPLFWRVTVERFGLKMDAIKRQDGLGAFLGSSVLASVMGPDEDLAAPVMEPTTLTVCETCATLRALPIAVLGLETKA